MRWKAIFSLHTGIHFDEEKHNYYFYTEANPRKHRVVDKEETNHTALEAKYLHGT